MMRAVLTIAVLALATTAHGEGLTPPAPSATLVAPHLGDLGFGNGTPAIKLASSDAAFASGRQQGVAKTAVERHFASDGVVGSLGYLCGSTVSDASVSGGGPASGYGRPDRFVGARIGVAFR